MKDNKNINKGGDNMTKDEREKKVINFAEIYSNANEKGKTLLDGALLMLAALNDANNRKSKE